MRFYLTKIILGCFVFLFSPCVSAEELIFMTPEKHYLFDVEVADTPKKAQTGLMYRQHLDANKGMIFIKDTDQVWHMWMKNTYLSLDMIFFNRDGRIIKIISDTRPFSLDILSSDVPVAGVVEVNAGTAQKLNLSIGDYIDTPHITKKSK